MSLDYTVCLLKETSRQAGKKVSAILLVIIAFFVGLAILIGGYYVACYLPARYMTLWMVSAGWVDPKNQAAVAVEVFGSFFLFALYALILRIVFDSYENARRICDDRAYRERLRRQREGEAKPKDDWGHC